jgi:hypothetical protein
MTGPVQTAVPAAPPVLPTGLAPRLQLNARSGGLVPARLLALVYSVARVEPDGEIVATLVRRSAASPEALLEGFCRFLRFETEQIEH